nr:hypothetical protein [Tanacetum cinerariifolium]
MGDANPICTIRDYSRPSHEGYRNIIKLPKGNNVVPLRSDTIRLSQNGCLFHSLRFEDPNQHLKDFLELVDSLNLDVANRERMRLRLFNFLFAIKLAIGLNSLSKAWTCFKDLLQKVPHYGIDILLQVQIFYDHVNPVIRRTIDQSAGGKFRDRNSKEFWALYDIESWNDPRDFTKLVKAISLPQDVSSTSDLCMENPKQDFVNYASSGEAGEQNRNASSPKHVHFVNLIIILNKKDEAKESAKSSATEYKDHEMTVESKEEFEDETDEETEEEEEDNPEYFDFFPTMKELGYH